MLSWLVFAVQQGIVLGIIFALQKIAIRHRTQNSYIAFALFIATSIVLWGIYATGTRLVIDYYYSGFLYVTSLYAIGPLYYMYYRLLLQPDFFDIQRAVWHFLPIGLAAIGELIVHLVQGPNMAAMLVDLLASPTNHILTIAIVAGCLHMLLYFIYLLQIIVRLYNQEAEIKLFARIGIVANILAIAALILILSGFLSQNMYLYFGGGTLVAAIHLALLLLSVRYPHFFQVLVKELKKKGYEKSLLTRIDVDGSLQAIEDYMTTQSPWREDSFGIRSLASAVGLSAGQVSQLLNEKLDIDFRNYTNRYRIDYAKELFEQEPDSNILSVCYQCGFNSKSAFNEAFKKFTGTTPSAFRAQTNRKAP